VLELQIEYLLGVAFAAAHDDSSRADFPPQPDRVFAALTAAWGARGRAAGEREALEWLERQDPPVILASSASERTRHDAFVPPNDDGVPRTLPANGRITVLPEQRRRQARQFPAVRPENPTVRLVWHATPASDVLACLDALARDTAYVGHSASLTRCRFRGVDAIDVAGSVNSTYRVYPGRLDELERAFERGERLDLRERNRHTPHRPARTSQSVFDSEWVVLADDGGTAPDIRAVAVVARKMRDALMSGLDRGGRAVPPWISGHDEAGAPMQQPHLAVVPMADIGWKHSEGRLMGLGLVVPRGEREIREQRIADIVAALGALSVATDEEGVPTIELGWAPGCVWRLSAADAPSARSLRSGRWSRPAQKTDDVPLGATRWQTATPIVLDRFPKAADDQRDTEIAGIVARACGHVGLPAPLRVQTMKHSAVNGAPSAAPSGHAPAWTGWALPEKLRGRALVHAIIDFPEPVLGPVILGAARYVGMGLCLPQPLEGSSWGT